MTPSLSKLKQKNQRPTERGSAVIGLVVLTPVMALLLFFVVAAGRLGVTSGNVADAARSAARTATQYGSPVEAHLAAIHVARTTLNNQQVGCENGGDVHIREMDLTSDGRVRVEVSCVVNLSDLTPLSIPGKRTISAHSTALVNRYWGGGT